jgi:protein-S-isoprenylcysteine O-methyltransferase Ste14
MEKLTFLGVGPKIGRFTLPWLVLTIGLTIVFPAIFTIGKVLEEPFLIAGFILMAVALVFYISSVRVMLPGIRGNHLVTNGPYRWCRNPLYSALMLFMVPGLGLLLNSWIILTTSVVAYLIFRKYIHEEEELLERIFGDEYRAYHDKTSLIFPNPFK